MNYFFSVNNDDYISELTIPKFKNKSLPSSKINLYSLETNEGEWILNEVITDQDKDFFYLTSDLSNNKIYFISENKNFKFNKSNLELIDNFTDTEPAFRSNLLIKNQEGGFSSYQSEYPYEMTLRKGNILSSLETLLNKKSDKNYIIFKNIFFKPINEKFFGYLIDYESDKILDKFELKTNLTNIVKINKKYINKNTFFFSYGYLGIPIFLNEIESNISLEHTHPLQLYIKGKEGFAKASELKNHFVEIIKKNENL